MRRYKVHKLKEIFKMTDERFMKRVKKIQRQLKRTYHKDVQINVEQDIDLIIDDVIVAYFDNVVNTKLYFTPLACNFSGTEILPIINAFNEKVKNLIVEYDSELEI